MNKNDYRKILKQNFLKAYEDWEEQTKKYSTLKNSNSCKPTSEIFQLLELLEEILFYRDQDTMLMERLLLGIITMYQQSSDKITEDKNSVTNEFIPRITDLKKNAVETQKYMLRTLMEINKVVLEEIGDK